ncbi:MAG TPA: MinD/ParA family protein, partial [Roseiflexaceae bacterium]|nr:MinD/ParA family protein [Roseiflexaceae bacterium]
MSKILSIHSYRGGTGKSNTTANLSTLLAARGLTVGIVDTDIQSPGVHVLFGIEEEDMVYTLNDYLWGKINIEQAAMDVTARVKGRVSGKIFLVPSSVRTSEIARILREGYDVGLLNDGFHRLVEELGLDVLVIDTHPGLSEETLLSIAISDILIIILRPDQQDYQGTGVTVEVARKLDVPQLLLLVNKVPTSFDFTAVREQIEKTYDAEVVAVLPHSDEMMTLASAGIFVLRYPDNVVTASLQQVA